MKDENELFLLKLKNEILLLEKMIKYNKIYNFKKSIIKKVKFVKINLDIFFCTDINERNNYISRLNIVENTKKVDKDVLIRKLEIKKENYLRIGGNHHE